MAKIEDTHKLHYLKYALKDKAAAVIHSLELQIMQSVKLSEKFENSNLWNGRSIARINL